MSAGGKPEVPAEGEPRPRGSRTQTAAWVVGCLVVGFLVALAVNPREREAPQATPGDASALRAKAKGLPPREALLYLSQAVRLAPEDAELLLEYGRCRVALGDHELALGPLGRAVRAATPGSALEGEARLAHGVALTELGRAEEARPDLERAAVLRPDDVSIDYFLGMGALLSGDSPRVISHMTRFSERSRNADRLVVALQVLADAHQSRGEARPALAALNQLAGLDPKNLIARALVARKRAEMEGFSVAFEAARAAARGPRADAGDHFALGILYAEWPGPGHGLAAIAALGSAAALAPRDRGPVLARARELERAGRPNSARLLLARRLGADPDDAEVLLALAGMERVAGDHSAARRRYNELLEVGARLPRRLRERAELGTLSSLLDEGEPAVAWAWVERLYGSLAPTDPRRLRLASALLRLGRLAEAEAALASLIKASSPARRSVPRGLRARVLLSANDREGARHEYRALVAEVGQGPLPLGLGLWAGVALSDADLPAARKLWRRAASTGPRWGPLAWQTRVCGFLAGDLSAEDVELALRLAEPDERNDARYLLGLGRRLTGVGGQRDFQRALALSARGEFPRRLIERALGE